jgi:hypothetical protein
MTMAEKIIDLKFVFLVVNAGSPNYEVAFTESVSQEIKDRLETYDIIKDRYTKEWVFDFINEFVKRLGIDGDFEGLTHTDCNEIYDSIMISDVNNNGIEFDSLIEWLHADACARKQYVDDAMENYCGDGDSLDLLRYAQLTEILQVYDVAYNFVMWYLGIEPEE